MKTDTTVTALSIALLLAFGAPAWAGTPDGQTPAEESVCDELQGATAGLYGLCVAFCEAQDCDFESATSGQCRAPNPKLLTAYDKKRKENDPPMPCLVPATENECPCFTGDELVDMELVTCEEVDWGFTLDTVLSDATGVSGVLVEVSFEDGSGRCMYRDESDPQNPILSDTATDATQTAACQQLVDEYVVDAGLVCHYHD